MKICAIISEFNPFHSGHKYLIDEIKKQGFTHIVAIMSGNFVERGEPAIVSKESRIKAALLNGIDLVIELPTVKVLNSAEKYAAAAVETAQKLGCIDALVFGSECGNTKTLEKASDILESQEFKLIFKKYISLGNSFPKSKFLALKDLTDDKDVISALKNPNNILGIEYIKALLASGSTMKPFAVKREGNDYHDTKLSSGFASASAIRSQIECEAASSISSLSAFLPETSFSLMEKTFGHTFPITEDDFSLALGMIINAGQMTNGMDLLHAAEMTPELYDRIQRILCTGQAFTFSELAQNLKTKNITRARINRALLHCLLSISQDDMELFRASGFCLYARILGFKSNASSLLKAVKNNANIPVITKLADAKNKLDETGNKILSHELASSFLYRQAVWCKFHETLPDEFRAGIVII